MSEKEELSDLSSESAFAGDKSTSRYHLASPFTSTVSEKRGCFGYLMNL